MSTDPWNRIADLRALAAADPSDALVWFMLGTALVQAPPPPDSSSHLHEAIEALRRCLELNPDHTAAHRWLGDAWRKLGQNAEAEAAYQSAIASAERTGELQVAKEARALLAKVTGARR